MAEMSNPVDVMGRELPYSQEAELAVIGSALTNLHSVAESVEILRPSDFYFPQNKEIDVYKRQVLHRADNIQDR